MASLLVTLAGLFGMHGLGSLGTDARSGHTAGSGTSTAVAEAMPGMDPGASQTTHTVAQVASAVAVALPVVTLEAAAPWEPQGGGMLMGAAGMCMAVLLLSLMAMAVHLHTSRLRPVAVLTARPSRTPAAPGRDPDPPSLLVLSIRRC